MYTMVPLSSNSKDTFKIPNEHETKKLMKSHTQGWSIKIYYCSTEWRGVRRAGEGTHYYSRHARIIYANV